MVPSMLKKNPRTRVRDCLPHHFDIIREAALYQNAMVNLGDRVREDLVIPLCNRTGLKWVKGQKGGGFWFEDQRGNRHVLVSIAEEANLPEVAHALRVLWQDCLGADDNPQFLADFVKPYSPPRVAPRKRSR